MIDVKTLKKKENAMEQELPPFLQKVIRRYPGVWEKYDALKGEIGSLDALDPRTQSLIKLAIAIGAGREGSVHSHARKCKRVGVSNEEMLQTALLAITTVGWSGAMAGLAWINDVIDDL